MNEFHTPVLLKEVIENLKIEEGKRYIDATIGGGGHSFEILEKGGVVLGIDVDQEAIEHLLEKVNPRFNRGQNSKVKIWERLTLIRGNFRNIDKIAHLKGFETVAGIIFDLGVSSRQLEIPERGFSFQKMGPLDMRMDKTSAVKASDLLQALTKGEFYELFTKLGEESSARRISDAIVSARKVKPIATTEELAEIVASVKPRKFSSIHPATLVFQALRIAVNDELNALKEALPKAVRLLEKKGRLLVISFHSLEDRIVKRSFIGFEKRNMGVILTKTPILSSIREISKNRRSRSAKLRIFETHSTSSG